MFTVHGGINASSIFNQAVGIPQRRQPFTWMLNGNLTGSFLGISLPFVFSYSNNQVNYTQTYNIKSFNPSYKWIRGYAGTTSMNFSQYTMSGHIFNGGGVELSPNGFRFAALYGQFRKAVEYDVLNQSDLAMSYRRMGRGVSVGYEKGSHGFKLIYFTAKDDVRSLRFIPVNTDVKPMQNTVISFSGRTTVLKKLSAEIEYAISSLNKNLFLDDNLIVNTDFRRSLFFNSGNSVFFSALKASLGYRFKFAGLAFNYEKIDPGYQTLGAYFFNNDLINYSIAPSLNLLNGKLTVSGNEGLQKNNLDLNKLNTTSRFVAAGNIMFVPTKNWNFMASYSNFNSFTRQRPVTDPFYRNTLDTLNFYQISQSSMMSAGYQFGSTRYKQNVSMSASFLKSGQLNGSLSDRGFYNPVVEIQTPDKNLNVNSAYNVMLTQEKINVSIIGNYNQSFFNEMNVIYYGPGINAGKSFRKNKLKLSAGSTFNRSETNGTLSAKVLSNRFNFTFNPVSGAKAGNLSLSASIASIHRNAVSKQSASFTEFNGNLSINYNF